MPTSTNGSHNSKALELQNLLTYAIEKDKPFLLSLIAWVLETGRAWSPKQEYWADKFLKELRNIEEDEDEKKESKPLLCFPNITNLFKRVHNKLAYPKIRYTNLTLSYNDKYSSIAIRQGNVAVAAINYATGLEQANFRISDKPELAAQLLEIEKSPISAAAITGKKTGYCCFCSRELTDERSVKHGYGPVCANNWSLPWAGERAGSTTMTITISGLESNKDNDIPS